VKKISITFLLFVGLASTVCAQDKAFAKGDKLLNLGVGVNSYYSGGVPLSVSFESGITDQISVGPSIDYLSNKYSVGGSLSYKFTALYFGVRASYHVNELLNIDEENIDLYGGVTIGYRSFSWKDKYSGGSLSGNYGSGIFIGGYIGGKYFFTQRFGAFAELGAVGSTNGRIGVAARF
jgi:hypothetical protein